MKKKTHIIIFALIILLVIVGSLLIHSKKSSKPSITLGVALALSGDAATWGEEDKNGITLALKDLDDNNIKIIFEDTHTKANDTINVGMKFASIDKVDAIIGPTWLDSFVGFTKISQDKNLITISPSASITAINQEDNMHDNVFSTWYRSDNQTRKIMSEIASRGMHKIALFYVNDNFTIDIAHIINNEAHEHGLDVVFEHVTNGKETDFKTALLKAKQKNTEAIIFWFSGEEETIPFLKQRKDLQMVDIPLYTTEWIQDIAHHKLYSDITHNIIYIAPQLNEEFRKRYRDEFDTEPTLSASNAYDTLMILVETIRNAGTDTEKMRKYLEETTFNTVTFGKLSFDDIHGVTSGSFKIYVNE